jgi:hypothetical protein
MADLKEFFRKTEIEIDTVRKTQEVEQQDEKQAAIVLKSLLEDEWKQVAGIIKSITVDETLDGKKFFWTGENTIMLGEATLTLKAIRRPYEQQLTYTSALGVTSGKPNETNLMPSLVEKSLRWQLHAAAGKKYTTEELADNLVRQLVNFYKLTQTTGVKGSV